jgi:hypothetical protein
VKKLQALVLAIMMLTALFVPTSEANAAFASFVGGFVDYDQWSHMYHTNQWSQWKDIYFISPPAGTVTLRSVGVHSIVN